MLILPDYGFAYIVDSVNGPVVPKYSWFYQAELNDFVLRPIRFLEETIGAAVRVRINGTEFDVPASWSILVVDESTKLVDTVQITQCSSSDLSAFLMHPDRSDYMSMPVTLLDLDPQKSCVHPMIPKSHMMLHPVGPVDGDRKNPDQTFNCLLSPQDLGKFLIDVTAMEILM